MIYERFSFFELTKNGKIVDF